MPRLKAENEALDRDNTFYRTQLGQRLSDRQPQPSDSEPSKAKLNRSPPYRGPVLICGERGTGKELIAAALHYGSNRRERAFVKMNCAALSDTPTPKASYLATRKGPLQVRPEMRHGSL